MRSALILMRAAAAAVQVAAHTIVTLNVRDPIRLQGLFDSDPTLWDDKADLGARPLTALTGHVCLADWMAQAVNTRLMQIALHALTGDEQYSEVEATASGRRLPRHNRINSLMNPILTLINTILTTASVPPDSTAPTLEDCQRYTRRIVRENMHKLHEFAQSQKAVSRQRAPSRRSSHRGTRHNPYEARAGFTHSIRDCIGTNALGSPCEPNRRLTACLRPRSHCRKPGGCCFE